MPSRSALRSQRRSPFRWAADLSTAHKDIIDAYDGWTLCQIQHNYMDVENQAGTEGLRHAGSRGLAVVIMEPLLGGKLVNPPDPVERLWDRAENKRSGPEWALQWLLWSQPKVSVVLSGMSAMEQVRDNVTSAARSSVGLLTSEELALIAEAREKYDELCPIPCTTCRYCMPCPNGVDIPRNFGIYNQGRKYDNADPARADCAWMAEARRLGIMAEDARASSCVQCHECELMCPQQIPISEWMMHVHRYSERASRTRPAGLDNGQFSPGFDVLRDAKPGPLDCAAGIPTAVGGAVPLLPIEVK